MSNFEEFDKKFDLEGLKNDIEDANNNTPNYEEVPAGTYEVKIEKLELTTSKTNKPMVKAQFRILAGDHTKQCIFMNQLVDEGFKIHIMNDFLKSLESDMEVYFDSFSQYNNLILDIHECIDGKLEYLLEYGENKKGFKTYTIKEVFEV